MRNPEVVRRVKHKYARSPRGLFTGQRKAAKRRGIGWELTFEEWLSIWADKLPMRGRTGLVMARKGDVGPYAKGNVSIMTARDNLNEVEMPHGENHPRAKLTAGCVARVRDLLSFGCTQRAIANRFGVVRTTISAIARGENWSVA